MDVWRLDIRRNTLTKGETMKEKMKELLDSRATWAGIAMAAGAFGEHYGQIVNAFGMFVMAVL